MPTTRPSPCMLRSVYPAWNSPYPPQICPTLAQHAPPHLLPNTCTARSTSLVAQHLHSTLHFTWKVNATGFGLINFSPLLARLRRCNHSTHEICTSFFCVCLPSCTRALTSFAVAYIDNSNCPEARREAPTRLCAFLMDCSFHRKPFLSAELLVNMERHDWNTLLATRVGKH